MSSVTIQEVYHKLLSIEEHMVTKEELEPLIETIEILSNHETMQALAKSDDDIKKGNGNYSGGSQRSHILKIFISSNITCLLELIDLHRKIL